jgi:alpha-galactosidase
MPVNWRKEKIDWDLYRRLLSEWREIADCMLGDYYPLTEYTLQNDRWIAWQFHRPQHGDGIIQAFRRDCSEGASMKFRLKGVDSSAQYQITDFDTGKPTTTPGRVLRKDGLFVEIRARPGAALLKYRKTD